MWPILSHISTPFYFLSHVLYRSLTLLFLHFTYLWIYISLLLLSFIFFILTVSLYLSSQLHLFFFYSSIPNNEGQWFNSSLHTHTHTQKRLWVDLCCNLGWILVNFCWYLGYFFLLFKGTKNYVSQYKFNFYGSNF